MKINTLLTALVGSTLLFSTAGVFAATSDTQEVTYDVGSQDLLTISGDPSSLNLTAISTETKKFVDATDTSTTMDWYHNDEASAAHITAAITYGGNMPSDLKLEVLVAAAGQEGTSEGKKELTTNAATVVTGITNTYALAKAISYTLSDVSESGKVAQKQSGTRTVTFTITAAA